MFFCGEMLMKFGLVLFWLFIIASRVYDGFLEVERKKSGKRNTLLFGLFALLLLCFWDFGLEFGKMTNGKERGK